MRSIRARLTVTLAIVMAVVILGIAGGAAIIIRPVLDQRDRTQLDTTAARIEASLRSTGGADVSAPDLDQLAGGSLGAILLTGGEVIASVRVRTEDVDRIVRGATPESSSIDSDYLVRTVDASGLGLRYDGVEVTEVILVVLTSDRDALTGVVVAVLVSVALVTVTILTAVAVLIVGRGLRPLDRLAEQAERIASGHRTTRLRTSGTGDPAIERVAATVNLAFDAQEDAENRMRTFVADASHELRTPLTSASGWIDLYFRGGLEDPARRDDAMIRIDKQLARLRLLAEELSTLAHTDAGRPLLSEPVDVAALAREIVSDAQLIAPDRDISIDSAERAFVIGDEYRLAQALRNLVGNAVQHTPRNAQVHVIVSAGATRHTIAVRDTGRGIRNEDLPHVFERFWRADTSRSTAGSGLGLAIVQAIIDAHRGTVIVRSVLGEGTEFRIHLPASDAEEAKPDQRLAGRTPST